MIFLFFGSSIAHLEPELQPFEDKSIFVGISATRAGFSYRGQIFSSIDSESACPDLSNGVGIANDITCFTWTLFSTTVLSAL